MNNKDLIKQYVDTGLEIPEYQYSQLSPNDLKTYGRKRIIAHNMHADDEGYNFYKLDTNELKALQPYLKNLPEINKKPFNIDKDSFAYYADIFPELLDDIPDDVIKDFPNIHSYEMYLYLMKKPELLKYFKNRINDLSNYQVIDIIEAYPELYPYFSKKLKSIDYLDVKSMVEKQPKLFKLLLKDNLIDNYYLDNILEDNPELSKDLPSSYFEKLDDWQLGYALERNPALAKNKHFIKAISQLKNYEKVEMVKIVPELINYFDNNIQLYDDDAIEIIKKNPKVIKKVINSVKGLNYILNTHPEYYKYLTPENKENVSKYTIINMLKENPNILKDVEDWVPEFDFYEMDEILDRQPKLLNYFLKINGDKLNDRELYRLKNR